MSKSTKAKKKNKVLHHFLMGLWLTAILAIIFCAAFFVIFGGRIQAAQDEASEKIAGLSENMLKRGSLTVIYDKDGNEIANLSSPGYIYTEYDGIPALAGQAFIATEDKDFFSNSGISMRGITRAFFSYLKNRGRITQGGSTITQQLVKNVLLTQDRTWSRKLTEIFIAVRLEKMYTKEQILEYYLNNINFSNGAYSIASAAHTYFNKTLDELNLAEITFLAAIPNNPTYYNPLKYYDHVTVRQHLMLYNLRAQNYISDEQYEDALNTQVVLNYQPNKGSAENYMTSYAIDSAVKALMQNDGFDFRYEFYSDSDRNKYEEDYDETYSEYQNRVLADGYKIYTSFDQNRQSELQDCLDKGLEAFKDTDSKTGLYKMQGAAVCIDNLTGEVIAAVGGRSQNDATNYFNRAYQAVRQPGSSIKPILVYTPAFDKGYFPNSTMIDHYIPNGPKNDENTFFGKVTLRYATELSLNTIAYQLLLNETTQYALPYLYNMRFAHIVSKDDNPIIAIGGFTYGVTPVELAGAYSTLARGGEFITPTCITKIENNNQDVVYDNPLTGKRIYKEDSAYYMTDVLKGVLTKKWATGYGLGLKNMPSAAKTGTTSSCKDGWFAGYTPYLTTVVWTGYDTPTYVPSLYGCTYPGSIWHNFMSKANEGLKAVDFDIPVDLQDRFVHKTPTTSPSAVDKTRNTSGSSITSPGALQAPADNNNEVDPNAGNNSDTVDNNTTDAGNGDGSNDTAENQDTVSSPSTNEDQVNGAN